MSLLRDCGHEITYDWTTNEQVSTSQAVKDRDGVFAADALIFIAEEDLPYKGAYVEMGMAIGRGIPVLVLGDAIDACIFTKLPGVISCTNNNLLTELLML